MPRFGLGTWRMGQRSQDRQREVAALRRGLEHGVRLIDTAEMYNDAESVVGEAISGFDDVFIVSKVLPENASRAGTPKACEASLRRLGVDVIDCYLLHWRGSHPLSETVDAFESLIDAGKIRSWGVSNFDVDDLDELAHVEAGENCVANQILYNLTRRGPEAKLLDRCRTAEMQVMAYSPLEQARLDWSRLEDIATRCKCTAAQLAIAWTMRDDNIVSIPKASSIEHVDENVAARELTLDDSTLRDLDQLFPRRGDRLESL